MGEKIMSNQIYLELIHKLMSVHKQYYFDKSIEWKTMSNGDKLQELCDSYCHQIKNILAHITNCALIQNNAERKKSDLGKKVLTKFYDALQLILALYAPRCGSGKQSNLKIKEKQIIIHQMHDIDDDEDDDQKMNQDKQHYAMNEQISYNEIFARRHNISKWLERVIKDEVDAEIKNFDQQI